MAKAQSGEEKVREFMDYLKAHPEIPAQWPEQIARGERGEGVPFRVVYEEAKRRDEEAARREEEERRRDTDTKPSS